MDPPIGSETGPFGGNRFEGNFRGSGGRGNYPMRDGFVQFFVADNYNAERFDFSRGPNALIFGSGGPGGLQGSGSRQIRFQNRSVSASTRLDSYGSYRGTIDFNQGFERLGVRVNALHQDTKAYQDGTTNQQTRSRSPPPIGSRPTPRSAPNTRKAPSGTSNTAAPTASRPRSGTAPR